MPINIHADLPAREALEKENIFVMDESRAQKQDIRPIEIAILNLMPVKQDTELQLIRALSNTPLQVNVTFLTMSSHDSKNTRTSHLDKFYQTFDIIKNKRFDGLIITGAPVETLAFEEVDYWDELTDIMAWSKTNVTSTYHICWGAQAALYYHYGINKYPLKDKCFGVFEHNLTNKKIPLIRGFDDRFLAPHSRHTTIKREDILECDKLHLVSESEEAGVFIVMSKDGRQIFVTGHPEYDRMTLDNEYKRDKSKGLEIEKPKHYYIDDDDEVKPVLSWRAHANTLYTNWLNYYVYQLTPYNLDIELELTKD